MMAQPKLLFMIESLAKTLKCKVNRSYLVPRIRALVAKSVALSGLAFTLASLTTFSGKTVTNRREFIVSAGAVAASSLLSGCASTVTPPASVSAKSAVATAVATNAATAGGAFVAPNANLTLVGMPRIEQVIADRAVKYSDFRGKGFRGWHPDGKSMLIGYREKNTSQIWTLDAPMGELKQLTDFPEPVRGASYEPKTGKYLIFGRDAGGSEAVQIYRMDLPNKAVTQLTDPSMRHDSGGYNSAEDRLLIVSTQLDKTAAGGTRKEVTSELSLIDPMNPTDVKKVASLPGGGWFGFDFSQDDKTIVCQNYKSATESELYLINVADGKTTKLLPRAGEKPVSYGDVEFSHDGKGLFITSDAAGEFKQLQYIDIASRAITPLTADINWDVVGFSMSKDRRQLTFITNDDGRFTMYLLDSVSRKRLPTPTLPPGQATPAGFSRDGKFLALNVSSAQGPGEAWTLELANGKLTHWTRAFTNGLDTTAFKSQQIIRYKSFDGRTISALVTMPPDKFKGPRPVLIDIHGGPEAQSTVGFQGRENYLINELGVALIEPNVRGSSGYGKTFISLDNGYKREDSVKDIGALLDWIATQPQFDVKRVGVEGGSYGGYMSLAVSTFYAERIRCAIDSVGISNFVTFLEKTESYRRDLRRVEYGDERDPAMRKFLTEISPLTNAHKIKKPLFVVQGRNDPRVPWQEADQIVAAVKKNDVPVWYLTAENEGHGFAKKDNADYLFYARIKFYETYLLG
jgi:dipeptidyl aminopeptidase/acylaminoacyl peptidase